MTTTYYTFRTRKVKVSGGPDLVTLVPEVQTAPAPRSAGEAKGEVLDFDFWRPRTPGRPWPRQLRKAGRMRPFWKRAMPPAGRRTRKRRASGSPLHGWSWSPRWR